MFFTKLTEVLPGILICFALATPCWFLGQLFPLVGGPIFAILLGMIIAIFWKKKGKMGSGISFTSKKILQCAVVFLGFGLNLGQVAEVGLTSLPVILSTITTSLVTAYLLYRIMRMDAKTSTLIGVGSSICGGSAVAATAPIIKANDKEVTQAISVVFLFNVIAALIFPTLGTMLGLSDEGFALFAGTAINDTSSVTAAAVAWDEMHPGANTLDGATIVKLTRTLAIIPITFVLALWYNRTETNVKEGDTTTGKFSLKRALPTFIILFVVASLVTTVAVSFGVSADAFEPLKTLSKFFIVVAMGAIGLNTDVIKLIKSGGMPILMGCCCWIAITAVSLLVQYLLGIW